MKKVRVLNLAAAIVIALSAILAAGGTAMADDSTTPAPSTATVQPNDLIWGG